MFSKRFLLLPFILILFFYAPVRCENKATPLVIKLSIEGIINPVLSSYIKDGLNSAEQKKAAAVVIVLDTPGGLLDTTRTIIQSILNTPIPVILYVSPRGARATSAGVFLMMASDVAAMAPETHLGAAHPVTLGPDQPQLPKLAPDQKKDEPKTPASNSSIMEEKMVSDAAAYIRTLALEHGRNADWAERAVRESVSLTSEEAVQQKVIDVVADSETDLLQKIDGRLIKKSGHETRLFLVGAQVEAVPMSAFRQFLQMLAHPNVAYILLTIGIYGLIYEFAAPGHVIGGVVGTICLVLAFFSLQILPINTAGVILIVLGFLLILFELFTPAHGALTFGGLISFMIGSFFLIDVGSGLPYPRVSLVLIVGTFIASALYFGVIVRKTMMARLAKPKTGADQLAGMSGEVKEDLNLSGLVYVNGELWQAEASSLLKAGEKVIVDKVSGHTLFVKKA